MEDSCEFDVRLVYLAIHHILKHRGHFLLENFEIREDGAVGFEEAMADLGNVFGQFWIDPYLWKTMMPVRKY